MTIPADYLIRSAGTTLNKDNWEDWSLVIRSSVLSVGCLEIMEGREVRPILLVAAAGGVTAAEVIASQEAINAWESKKAKVWGYLVKCLGDNYISMSRRFTLGDAPALWSYIHNYFEQHAIERQRDPLKAMLDHMRMEPGEDLENSYAARVNLIADRFVAVGGIFNEGDRVFTLLNGLPSSVSCLLVCFLDIKR
jgi:glutathione S-transferase